VKPSLLIDDPEKANHPVVYVTWADASAFCDWVDARLSTEAEWEKAARGGLEGKSYPWGDKAPICTPGAENGAQYWPCDGETVPVRTFSPNNYGLYDMAGNVWEWVADWYDRDYYKSAPANNPTGPESGTSRVLRGGSGAPYADYLRVAHRSHGAPSDTDFNIGFRCARDATP
jgi:formylglycine-generating enzyme required for sulfatase activity